MTVVIQTTQTNLNSSNISKQLRAICDGLAYRGDVVVLIDRWGRYWKWRNWKKPIANSHLEWQQTKNDN